MPQPRAQPENQGVGGHAKIITALLYLLLARREAMVRKYAEKRKQLNAIIDDPKATDEARDEARKLLEEHRKLIAEARGEAEEILAEARKTREAMEQRMREETEAERQRRLEETRKEIAAETARALEQIRAEVADLTLEAASRVVGRALDPERDRQLIEDAIESLDFSRLEEAV